MHDPICFWHKPIWISSLQQAAPLQAPKTYQQHTMECVAALIPVTMPVRQCLLQEAVFKPGPCRPNPGDLWMNFSAQLCHICTDCVWFKFNVLEM